MTIFNGIILYVCIWFVVIFTVLPWGVRRVENQAEHDVGAPEAAAPAAQGRRHDRHLDGGLVHRLLRDHQRDHLAAPLGPGPAGRQGLRKPMSRGEPTLHLICGKIAAGKSTLARRLAAASATCADRRGPMALRALSRQIATAEDYVRCSGRLGEAMAPHVEALLRAGLSVVHGLSMQHGPAPEKWMRGIFEAADSAHELHYLEVPDEVCKARLRQRNEQGGHDFTTGEADYDLITSHFVPPSPEGLQGNRPFVGVRVKGQAGRGAADRSADPGAELRTFWLEISMGTATWRMLPVGWVTSISTT